MKDNPDPLFPPTRDAALARLEAFAPKAGRDYAAGRNHDLPGHPHVSTLSPWIRHRALTEAEVAAATLDRFAASTAQKFLSEVLWRTYFKGYLERRPGLWSGYLHGLDVARNRLATESGLRARWEAACGGETGIDAYDHWAAELTGTGYLHNHARMWFASIWMHTLELPWELGADFFLRHLLDGDPASNTLSWRWVGGLHTRGKTYRARASNIGKYTGGRFDTEALGHRLATTAEPQDGPPPPDPIDMPEDASLPGGRVGLLLHEDDLHPDFLMARGLDPAGVAVLIAPAGRSPLAVSRQVHDFTRALAEDAAVRLGATGPVTEDGAEIARWAKGFDHVVSPYAPVGPARMALNALNIATIRPLRAWDAAAWPHATAGFFKVKGKMATILETIPQDMGV
ncbi:FAD-binding domain-containing protein [uncultured Jannaschia sp.]|uniref:FAD-binding domain-containing protein n=1 Tax=uncultured Jannaschia sp. TaxID=293347 RepID=UPI00262830A2|nr:FAD-binding domain-containing protein [uncultured Jannaschia sp.]